jgi:hypothetical protein
MMEFISNDGFEGETSWGKLVHKEATNFMACQAVRNRLLYIKKKINNTSEKASILNVAAGSGREMREFVRESPEKTRQFLALDHDINTIRKYTTSEPTVTYGLANAFHFIKNKNRVLFPKHKYLHVPNPKQDLKDGRALWTFYKYTFGSLKNDSYELVYSIGLFDYIRNYENKEKGAKKLTSFLFDKVKSRGKLVTLIIRYHWIIISLWSF